MIGAAYLPFQTACDCHPSTTMPKAVKGVLVECDPSIKAIVLKIDSLHHDFIVEDLDDQTLVVKESKLNELKQRLEDELANTQQMPEDSGSEDGGMREM